MTISTGSLAIWCVSEGGPILIPEGPHLKLRHVYGGDVVRGIVHLAATDIGVGEAYNFSQDEELSIEEFLQMLATIAGTDMRIVSVPRQRLESERLIPDCSPFSDPWMSALDNRRSKREFGMTYTPLPEYLSHLVDYLSSSGRVPPGYKRRPLELQLALELLTSGVNVAISVGLFYRAPVPTDPRLDGGRPTLVKGPHGRRVDIEYT